MPLFAHRQLYLMAGVHEMKTYNCVHEASCIAIAKEIKNKIHKTHKTTVKQRKNKMKNKKIENLTVKLQYNNTTLRKNIVVFY